MKYQTHPLAELFPMMSDSELKELSEDIKKHGCTHAVTLFEGKVLDGRNRLRACELAGVDPKFREHKNGDALDFVISANLHRRHLTTSQRAMVASKMSNLQVSSDVANLPPTRTESAKLLAVSPRTVTTANKISDESPKLAKQVVNGSISLNKAVKELKEAKASAIPNEPGATPKLLDKEGNPMPPGIVELWKAADFEAKALTRLVSEVRSMFRVAMDKKNPIYNEIKWQDNFVLIEKLLDNFRLIAPHGLCTTCNGIRSSQCTTCRQRGFMSHFAYKFYANDQAKAIRQKARQA